MSQRFRKRSAKNTERTTAEEVETKKRLIADLLRFYDETRRTDEYEPKYRIHPFDCLDELTPIELQTIYDAVVRPGFYEVNEFPFGMRVIDGLWKVGTSSWVFWGRKTSDIIKVGKAIAVGRDMPMELVQRYGFPAKRLYCLYEVDDDGFLIDDRVPGFLEDIKEIKANPAYFGISV